MKFGIEGGGLDLDRSIPCYVSACHHGMARSRVADGAEGLQMWRIAASLLNDQPWTADNVWSSSLRVGGRANNSSP